MGTPQARRLGTGVTGVTGLTGMEMPQGLARRSRPGLTAVASHWALGGSAAHPEGVAQPAAGGARPRAARAVRGWQHQDGALSTLGAPPELPGLMAASVWMKLTFLLGMPTWSGLGLGLGMPTWSEG